MIALAPSGEGCRPFDFLCIGGQVASKMASDAWQQTAYQMLEAFGRAVASLGTIWVYLPTPPLMGPGGGSAARPYESGGFTALLQYAIWIGAGLAVLSLIGFGAWMGWQRRHGGSATLGRLGAILGGTALIGTAGAIVAALLPAGGAPGAGSEIVSFLQNGLWFYTGGLAILGVIVAGARMVWEQRADPGKDLIGSLIRLGVVAGAGVVVINIGTQAADGFSVWILNQALDCDVNDLSGEGGGCFGRNIALLIGLSSGSPVGSIGVVIAALFAMLMSLTQILLMVIRGGMLVLLAGLLPTAAAMHSTQMGKVWWERLVGWAIAFILYKPAAAFVYAAAFKLTAADPWQDDGGGFVTIMTGLGFLLLALIALPALLRFVTPAGFSAAAGAGAGALAAGGVLALADGAIRVNRGGHANGAGAASPDGLGSAGAIKAGVAGSGSATSAGSVSTGSMAGAGAPAGGAGAAAGGAAAAAGPVGVGVAVAGAAVKAGREASGAVRALVDEAGEGSER